MSGFFLSLSVFLSHKRSCFLYEFNPHCYPRCTTLQDHISSYFVFFSVLPNTGAFLATPVTLWPQLKVACSRWTPEVFIIFTLCEAKVKSHITAPHRPHVIAYSIAYFKSVQLHVTASAALFIFHVPSSYKICIFPSLDNPLSPSTNKQQMLKCLLWLILDLQYRVPFSYTSAVLQCAQCVELILFSKQSVM